LALTSLTRFDFDDRIAVDFFESRAMARFNKNVRIFLLSLREDFNDSVVIKNHGRP